MEAIRSHRNPATPLPLKERRLSSRLPTPALQIAIEKPGASGLWVADALDISDGGLGMVLSPEFNRGTEVLLTFQLGEAKPFLRLPAVVLRQELGIGAVRFKNWSQPDRDRLAHYLLRHSAAATSH